MLGDEPTLHIFSPRGSHSRKFCRHAHDRKAFTPGIGMREEWHPSETNIYAISAWHVCLLTN